MIEISIAAEKIFSAFGFPVTNALLMGWLVVLTLTIVSVIFLRRPALVPGGVQNVFEFAAEGVIGLMEGPFGSREKAEKYFPFIATIFIFILLSNWFGIMPFLGSVGIFEESHAHPEKTIFVPFFRSTASDLNFTLALAVISVLATQLIGVASIGFFRHVGRYLSFKSPIQFFVGILEIVSEIAKMISFSFRLFGNIFAGEVLLIIVSFLIPVIVPVPFLMLEIFVGFIQALVFAMLTLVFISIATVEHH